MTRRGALVVVALLCGLAACSDDPNPGIPEPSPSSTSPTLSESVSPTTSTETPEALTPEETVRAWFEAWSAALTTGETLAVQSLSSPECRSCTRLIEKLRDLYAKGGSLETAGWRPIRMVEDAASSEEAPVFLLRIAESRQVLFDERGEQVDETARTEVPMRMTLGSGDAALVTRLEILS